MVSSVRIIPSKSAVTQMVDRRQPYEDVMEHQTVDSFSGSQTVPATAIITGIAEGMRSAAGSAIVVAAGIGGASWAGEWAMGDGSGI